MMWGRVCRICGLFSAIGFCLLVLNSFGCNYEMTLQSDEARYYGVCHGGKVTFLEQDAQRIAWRLAQCHMDCGKFFGNNTANVRNGSWFLFVHNVFKNTPKNKSIGDKSGARAGHSIGPRRPIHLP